MKEITNGMKSDENVKYKYKMENLMPFDFRAVERHLTKMAEMGLQLEETGKFLWKYRKTEPAHLEYSVTYVPESSIFDASPTEAEETLTDFCAQAGWKKVCEWDKMKIYATEQKNPVPIDTDEKIRLDLIEESMNRSFVPGLVILSLMMLFSTWRIVSDFFYYPIETLADYSGMISLTSVVFGTAFLLLPLAGYWRWVNKSKKVIESGGVCPEPRFVRYFINSALIFLIAYFIIFIVTLISEGEDGRAVYLISYFIGLIILVLSLDILRKTLRKKGVSKGKNIAAFIIVDIVLAFLLVFITNAISDSFEENPPHYTDENFGTYTKTFIASHEKGEIGDGKIYCEISEVKWQVLFDWCHKGEIRSALRWKGEDEKNRLREKNKLNSEEYAEFWGTDTAYSCDEEGPDSRWILTKGNRIFFVNFRNGFNDDDKAALMERLNI